MPPPSRCASRWDSSDDVLADGSVDFNSVVQNALLLWNQQLGGTQFTSTIASAGTAASMGDGR